MILTLPNNRFFVGTKKKKKKKKRMKRNYNSHRTVRMEISQISLILNADIMGKITCDRVGNILFWGLLREGLLYPEIIEIVTCVYV